jgi:NAD(P)-dependent dehydrogenase (short-subunit alcohol dehydrogenase family)
MDGLAGKVAIVAGGGAGLGRAKARRLAREGVTVVVGDINEAAATHVAASICANGDTAVAFRVDISSEQEVSAMVDFKVEKYGTVQLLHNVAADLRHCMTADFDLLGTTLESFDHTIAVDLRGYVLTCRAVLPHMIESGGGAIVNTSSLAAIRTLRTGNRCGYAIAKASQLGYHPRSRRPETPGAANRLPALGRSLLPHRADDQPRLRFERFRVSRSEDRGRITVEALEIWSNN